LPATLPSSLLRLSGAITLAVLTVLALGMLPFAVTRAAFIDLHSGRKRDVVRVGSLPVYSRISETPYSQMWLSYFGPYPAPNWTPESEYRGLGGRRSPCYGFLGAFRWEDCVVSGLNYAAFDPDLKRLIVANFAAHLKKTDSYKALRYSLGLLAYAMEHEGQKIDSANSPSWLKQGVFTGDEL
jgi:hypothetical protein